MNHMNTDRYQSPLSERYASREMQYLFSPDKKFRTWRRLWIALAQTEQELGLSREGKPVITQEQIDELIAHQDDINYEVAKAREKEVRHDVMSHIYAYGQQCPKAAGIIHLGATSCYVGDNTDVIIMKEALNLVRRKLLNLISVLADFADRYKSLPTLAFTHFQPAQPTTVGKRAALWLQEYCIDLEDLEYISSSLKLLGSKGTTGTQASFLELFDGDQEKVDQLDPILAHKMGFTGCYPVSGQTYSRKIDTRVANILSGIAASAHKMSNDIRLLAHLKEIEEPFEKNQIGSSAMAYKRNPMRSERIASLARYVMIDALNPAITSAVQWFERTLDDSANKRLSIPESFLAVDGILDLCINVVDGLVVYPKVIEKHLQSELPFMATENIMMDAVKEGGNRQELHEKIRELSMEAGRTIKIEGKENNLLERIAQDPAFHTTPQQLQDILDPKHYIGCAPTQVENYLTQTIRPLLAANQDQLGLHPEITV
jgi:adenylosuccinate lyase